ncbi:MAG: SRPBCC family protein [Ferrovibrio sp.]|uniref:SRPBCC family protein n=1 Tax=Ferrovibrio sp. TaxID=1917215 RepID=UPI002638D174|nr:SRPBCC family protein [Ferrovibrio sp.]MCW0233773.1 SRPBCC family protein [Ferrovibrio sp.]
MTAAPHTVLPCKHLSVSIPRPFTAVYAVLKDPANWKHWASGLGQMQQDAATGRWTAQQDGVGVVTIVFTPPNDFGVLDHRVTLPDGSEIYMPARVIANGDGCEVIFTLFRIPTMDDAMFARDAAWVKQDLEKLAGLFAQG